MLEQFKDKELPKHFKDGLTYQQSMGFTKNWAEYERFLAGNQWPEPTEATKNLPRCVFNIIAYIQNHKKASVQAEDLKMIFTPEELDNQEINPELMFAKQGADMFTELSETTWERLEQDKLNDEVLASACNIGAGIVHYFWDNSIVGGISNKYIGDFLGEFIDPSNCFFGNPQVTDVQRQPYILISSRELLQNVREEARKNGVPDVFLELITGDKDTNNEIYDGAKKEVDGTKKCNILTEYYKKGGTIWFKKVCNDIIITPETDTGLTRYPIALMPWKPRKKCIYGIGDTEGLIPNQKAINFNLSMMLLSTQNTAWPKLITKPSALRQKITNTPGEIITDYYVGQGSGIDYLRNESFNPMSLTLTDKFVELTKEFSNANDSSMGNAFGADASAQAIMLLQRSSGTSLEDIKKRFYRFMEDVGHIWVDFWTTKYNLKRPVRLKDSNGVEYTEYIVGSDYYGLPFYVNIDVGQATSYSEFAQQSTLDKLFDKGAIDTLTYVKYSSPNSVPHRERLMNDIMQLEQQRLMEQQIMAGLDPQGSNMGQQAPIGEQGNQNLNIPPVKEPNLDNIKGSSQTQEIMPTLG